MTVKDSYYGITQGTVVGKLTVLGKPFRVGVGSYRAVVMCECGKVNAADCHSLSRGTASQCWECACRGRSTHRAKKTKLYGVWRGIRRRCNPDVPIVGAEYYADRGIRVCKEWEDSFIAFRDWSIATGYKPGLQIDRIDNNGNYEPENCRWATPQQNCRNKRNNRRIAAFGEEKLWSEWLEDVRCAVNGTTLLWRLGRGWDTERAITTPARHKKDADG